MEEKQQASQSGSGANAHDHGVAAGDRGIAIGGSVSHSVLVTGQVAGDVTLGYSVEQVQSLLTQISSTFQPRPFDGRCPYLGLDAFDEADADRFFGREKLVAELVRRVEASRSVFITGPSGSGKSSLARAGLLHTLKQGALAGSDHWQYAALKPGRDPIEALALAAARMARSPDAGDYLRRHAGQADALHKTAEAMLTDRVDQRALILVDQFEEIYTQVTREAERRAFLALLTQAATAEHGRVIVLFAMRSDFVSNCAAYPQLNALLNRQFLQVGAMQSDELVSAIAQPALRVGLKIDPDLIAQIINDMKGEPGALPLMQFALKDLFDAQQAQGGLIALTLADYLQRGGVHRSLERHADAEFAKLSEAEQRLARNVFTGLIQIGRGSQDTRRTAMLAELAPADVDPLGVEAVVHKLADARLITTDEQAGQDIVTIAHEKLIDAWPWLRRLVNENRNAIALQNQIAEDAQEWERSRREASYLYVGARLARAREQLAAKKIVLSGLAQAFIASGIQAADAGRQREEARRQKELDDARRLAEAERLRAEEQARAAAKLRQRAMYLIGALGIALLLGIAAAVFGVRSNQAATEAQRQFRLARSFELAAVSINILDSDPELSLHLAMLYSDTYSWLGEDALQRALVWPPVTMTLHGHAGAVYSVAYDGAGKRLVTASADGTARIWDAVTGQELMVLQGHTGAVNAAAFSPDGQFIATAGADGSARIWDAATGSELTVLQGHTAAVNSVAFSPDGERLVTASDDATARVWQLEAGRVVYVLDQHTAAVRSAVFSRNGQFIATGGYDATLKIWDAATGGLITSLSNSPEAVNAIAFSPDDRYVLVDRLYDAVRWDVLNEVEVSRTRGGHTWYVAGVAFSSPDGRQVVTASRDHTARIWDTTSGQPIVVLRGHGDVVHGAAFDPAGDYLATASADQTVRIWDIAGWRKRVLIGHADFIYDAAYSSDGRRIATVSQDGTIRVWDAQSGREIIAWPYPESSRPYATGVAFSPDDRQLITTGDDGTWRLWDAATGADMGAVPDTFIVHEAQFSPDGTLIITTGRNNLGIIWDAATKEPLTRLVGHEKWVATGRFSPDGQLAVTASADASARIWEVRTGRPVHILTGHSALVTSAAFSADGKQIVTSSVDSTARIWDTATGQILRILSGHAAEVTDALFSPDDKYIATAGRDDTVRLWDAASGNEIRQLRGHTYNVVAVSFSPDGRYLLSASLDGTARVYPVEYKDMLMLARSLLSSRELTCVEQVKYLRQKTVCPTPTPAP